MYNKHLYSCTSVFRLLILSANWIKHHSFQNNAVGQGFEISGVKSAFLTGIFVLKGTFFVP